MMCIGTSRTYLLQQEHGRVIFKKGKLFKEVAGKGLRPVSFGEWEVMTGAEG